jgi:uncharacterized RDD family membrane protein YckC
MVTPMPPAPSADPTAVFGRRVAASVIDGVVVLAPGLAIVSSQFEYRDVADGSEYCDRYIDQIGGFCTNIGDTVYYADDGGGAADLVLLGLAVAVFVVLQGLTGWTIGKRILGLRCVRADGQVPGIGKALLRWVLWIVDGLPCAGLVGFITGLTTVGHRRVGDMAAGTFVVRADAAGSPIEVPGLTAPATGAYPVPPAGAPPWPGAVAPPPPPPLFPAPTAKEGPQWDEARGTYIQWDPTPGAWMQWDDAIKQWVPIR